MNKPIFIMGCPRSGTTIAMQVMAAHRELAWISNYLNRFPRHPGLSVMNRIYSLLWFGRRAYRHATQETGLLPRRLRRFVPQPVEPWNFWCSHISKFQWERGGAVPPRSTTAADITREEIDDIRSTVRTVLVAQGKRRFLSKYTDFPRMTHLSQAFPDARFVHILRDGRAVAASYHEEMRSGRFGTWNEREWWVRGWPAEWRREWQERFGTPLTFAAFQWKFFVDEIVRDAKHVSSEQYLEVRYKDMIASPFATFNRILDFCELKRSPEIEWYLSVVPLVDTGDKWKRKYPESDRKMLEEVIHEPHFRALLDA